MSHPASFDRRPDFVSEDWLRCTKGFSFTYPPPAEIRADRYLTSSNSWEQLLCITLQAQSGDFRNAEHLLDLVMRSSDSHLRDCAVTVFGFCAPSQSLARIGEIFHHSDYDTRLEAYVAACLTGSLTVAELLCHHRTRVTGYERERVMDHLSSMLEPESDSSELIDSPLADSAFVEKVGRMVNFLCDRHGVQTAIFHGEPLRVDNLASSIAALCSEEDPEQYGGIIAQLFSLLEAMTGVPYSGCLDDDCNPVLSTISYKLNTLRQSNLIAKWQPGCRYFFGHKIP